MILHPIRVLIVGVTLLSGGGTTCAQNSDELYELEETAMREAVNTVAPSVVRIETFASVDRLAQVAGTGPTTGLLISQDGYVLSSAFNFVAKPESILVTLHDGSRVSAEIHAHDRNRQLVLLKLALPGDVSDTLVVPTIAPKSDVHVGQWAIAVGRTLDVQQPNMSVGIISATDRIWGKAIQTDAKISPNNYGGPLIDISGRVLGILAPLSPQGGSEFAGTEWYDSGIGFAVPLDDINRRIGSLIAGEDLLPGLMGIALKGNDLFGSAAEVAVCRQRTPAFDAGIRVGDIITAIDETPIARQSQLKHALGPRYAGDLVKVRVQRDKEELEFDVTLTDKLIPYAHPFLGILPRRNSDAQCVVRFVYPDSPADTAGIQPDDVIMRVDQFEVTSADKLRNHVATFEDKQSIKLTYIRNGEEQEVDLTLAELPVDIPAQLPKLTDIPSDEEDVKAEVVEIKLPEEAGDCVALIPANYDENVPHGLVVEIAQPGEFSRKQFESDWSKLAAIHRIIVLAPQPKDNQRWLPTESEFVRKTIDNVNDTYEIDPNRIVLFGYRSGGSMAFLTAFRNRETVRGVATVDTPISLGRGTPEPDPTNRLAIYAATATESKNSELANATLDLLRQQRFPVTQIDLGTEPRPLDNSERAELCRWVDSLDRI